MNGFVMFWQHFGRLIGRLALGGILIAHGWLLWRGGGTSDLAGAAGAQYSTAPTVIAQGQMYFELIGGILLVLGLITPLVALLVAVEQIAIIALVTWQNGFWVPNSGWEFNLAMAALALMVVFHGSGRLGLDALFLPRAARPVEAGVVPVTQAGRAGAGLPPVEAGQVYGQPRWERAENPQTDLTAPVMEPRPERRRRLRRRDRRRQAEQGLTPGSLPESHVPPAEPPKAA